MSGGEKAGLLGERRLTMTKTRERKLVGVGYEITSEANVGVGEIKSSGTVVNRARCFLHEPLQLSLEH